MTERREPETTAVVRADAGSYAGPDELASAAHWQRAYEGHRLEYSPQRVLFTDLFERCLPTGGTCFEIGCFPGDYLIWLGQHKGYVVSGVDSTARTAELARHIESCGVRVGIIEQGDVFASTPAAQYDVVCSFGFIEHFDDVERAIGAHLDRVGPGGWVVLSTPSFRGLQYVLHWLLDRENLRRHSVSAMDPAEWQCILRVHGFEVVCCTHWGTGEFWVERSTFPRPVMLLVRAASWSVRAAGRLIGRPSRHLSPYAIVLARRPGHRAATEAMV